LTASIVQALEIASRQASASARLRAALVDGGDTSAIRRELADLQARSRALAAAQAQADAEEDELVGSRIAAAGAALHADARRRIQAMMAALEIPPSPAARAAETINEAKDAA
jgi:hypothetical protein